MIQIKQEILAVQSGAADKDDNVLKNAPHTLEEITANDWEHAYSRSAAAYPLPGLLENKFWASVARINNAYGDKNIVCTCPTIESYMEDEKEAVVA